MSEVEVTCADFNGSSWDGAPFKGDNDAGWLERALESGDLRVYPCDRDYAVWDVQTSHGIVRALPGDKIKFLGPNKCLEVIERVEKYRDGARLPTTQGTQS